MNDILFQPGAPAYALSFVGILLAAIGLQGLRPQVTGLLPTPRGWTMRSRLLVGQFAALVCVALVLAVVAQTPNSQQTLLLGAAGLAAYLYFGLVLPRKPKVEAEKRRRAIRKLTPGFVAYIRVALAGFDSPAQILERYAGRIDPRSAPLRDVVIAALEVMQQQRQRPFAALRDQARITGCQELIDLAETLAQAEAEGAPIQKVLQQHEQTLTAILEDEFKQMLKRRTIYLLLLVAISVVVGILGNLLYVMIGSVLFK
jgi:hypothetical protein